MAKKKSSQKRKRTHLKFEEEVELNQPENNQDKNDKPKRKFVKHNRKQNIHSDRELKIQILPNWMKNGQILENWDPIDIKKIKDQWINNNLKTATINYINSRKKARTTAESLNIEPEENEKDEILLFPVQIAALPAFTRSMQLTKDFMPLLTSSSSEQTATTREQKIIRSIFLQKRKMTSIGYGDLLISAPTGSGKTLAYAIPLIQSLESRIIPQIRAIILLPSRDLAIQVFNVLKHFIDEKNKLLQENQSKNDKNTPTIPLRVLSCFGQTSFKEEQNLIRNPYFADILVATPGRLIDHLNYNLNLQHVQFLIIDEADRLLMESYQDWVYRVFTAARPHNNNINININNNNNNININNNDNERNDNNEINNNNINNNSIIEKKEEYQSLIEKLENTRNQNISNLVDSFEEEEGYKPLFQLTPSIPNSTPLRKYLISATLTRNPAKIASLHLNNPLYFHSVASGRFKIPNSLSEYMVICKESGEKPLVLISLLNKLGFGQTLCFTKSVDSTHRLFLLLKLMGISNIAEYSSNLPQVVRTNIIQQFRNSQLKVLICSDAMARGMDLEQISTVINYDVPPFVKTYVHRIGRTARAGKEGTCYSILRPEDIRHFKDMRRKAEEPERLKNFKLSIDNLEESLLASYEKALEQLKSTLEEEKLQMKIRKK